MKQFKILNYLLVAVLCLGFASCSDDDDDYDPANLVGTWQLVRSEGWEINEDTGKKENYDEDLTDELDFVVYSSDGTGYWYWGEMPQYHDDFTWTLKGNKITITENKEDFPAYIKELNSNKAVIEYDYEDGHSKDTYKRIK